MTITKAVIATIFLTMAAASHLGLTPSVVNQTDRWKDITILRTTRAEVEKMMGKGEEHAFIIFTRLRRGRCISNMLTAVVDRDNIVGGKFLKAP